MQDIPYASAVGTRLYALTCTHSNISFAVSILGRYRSNHCTTHWKAAKKVMRYLQGMKEHILTYRRSDHLEVIGHSNPDLAGCLDTKRSTSRYICILAGRAISWKSNMQATTFEPEFGACFVATTQAIWLFGSWNLSLSHLKYIVVITQLATNARAKPGPK